MTEKHPTPKEWQRRALKAEAELESLRQMRRFEHGMEMDAHRRLASMRVALNEIADTLEWERTHNV